MTENQDFPEIIENGLLFVSPNKFVISTILGNANLLQNENLEKFKGKLIVYIKVMLYLIKFNYCS